MRGQPSSFWAKLRQSGDASTLEWHPLLGHSADVGAVAEALLELPLWQARIARVAAVGALDATTRARLAALAFLHDLGKLTIPFQAKGRPDLGPRIGGHVDEAVAAIDRDDAVNACLAPVGRFGDGAGPLLIAAVAHHGQPRTNCAHQPTRWRARGGLDPMAGLGELVERCRTSFPLAFRDGPPLPWSAELEHAFAGLVMLADWLASDTHFFPFSDDPREDRMAFARERARTILPLMGLDYPVERRRDASARSAFERVSPFPARSAQRQLSGLRDLPQGSIAVLESETGSGKTEAALARFVELYARGEVDGLYFALPTRTAATQIFRRVCDAVLRAFPTEPRPPVVLAVPGYLRVDDATGKKLAPFEVLWPDADRFRYRGWAAEGPKRFLVGTVVIGTIDQVLLSSLRVPHAHLRATSLLRHLLVVDEVHASDAYMTRILEDVLASHARAGGHALLLSATLGGEARARLMSPRAAKALPGFREAAATAYPLVSVRPLGRDGEPQALPIEHDGRDREIAVSTVPVLENAGEVAAMALERARRGARVLVLRNTVADCVETQLAIEARAGGERTLLFACRGLPAPHHGRFARADREALDEALERTIGKHERAETGCVVVATQTVQQSLDLDADLMITDLSPADVLLQRLGRLHRHERPRPTGFEQPRALVLVPTRRALAPLIRQDGSARNHHGLGSVYPDLRVLEATWRLLERESVWRVPAMNRSLVESAVHSEALERIVAEAGEPFGAHARFLAGSIYGVRRQAELNLVDWTQAYSQMAFPQSGDERIKARLGEGDRRIQFSPALPGPFGNPVNELVIRAGWGAGAPPDAQPEEVEACAGEIRFRFGPRQFVYDRLGLRLRERPSVENEGSTDDDGT